MLFMLRRRDPPDAHGLSAYEKIACPFEKIGALLAYRQSGKFFSHDL